jgi:hypothetical protein
MRHVPVNHVLAVLDGDNIAQAPRGQNFMQDAEERRVAEHMADLQQNPFLFRRVYKMNGVIQPRGHWLFQQNVIAGIQRR